MAKTFLYNRGLILLISNFYLIFNFPLWGLQVEKYFIFFLNFSLSEGGRREGREVYGRRGGSRGGVESVGGVAGPGEMSVRWGGSQDWQSSCCSLQFSNTTTSVTSLPYWSCVPGVPGVPHYGQYIKLSVVSGKAVSGAQLTAGLAVSGRGNIQKRISTLYSQPHHMEYSPPN